MKKQNRARANCKPVLPIFQFQFDETVLMGLSELSKKFWFVHMENGRLPDQDQLAFMAARLIRLGLAYIDVTAPRLMAMIKYCEAEGLDQETYLHALTEVKFKKKLHVVRKQRRPDDYDD